MDKKIKIINENLIRFKGKFGIEKPLDFQKDYIFKVKVNVEDSRLVDLQNGEFDQIFACGILDIELDKD